MQQDILVNWSPQETRVAVVEFGAVQELHVERTLERGLVGNVYLGKVSRVLPGMQSAFIDIGLDKAAFLHVADVWQKHAEGEAASARTGQPLVPIEKQVFEGRAIMVQVIKDPMGTKGARLSTQISIAGRHLVFLPQDDHIGVSQKIPSDQRDALRQSEDNFERTESQNWQPADELLAKINTGLNLKADELEQKSVLFCQRLTELDQIETQLQQRVPQLLAYDVVTMK